MWEAWSKSFLNVDIKENITIDLLSASVQNVDVSVVADSHTYSSSRCEIEVTNRVGYADGYSTLSAAKLI